MTLAGMQYYWKETLKWGKGCLNKQQQSEAATMFTQQQQQRMLYLHDHK